MTHAEYYRGLEAAQHALARRDADDPSARAAAVHLALAPLLADTPAAPERACRAGCAHCCHFPVGITFPEASRLLEALDGNAELVAGIRRDVDLTAEMTSDDLAGRPCPLLQDGNCAVYAARPLPCRALASSDAASCEAALHCRTVVPVDDTAYLRGLGAGAALAAATPTGTRELRTALGAMLAAPSDARPAAFAAARRPRPPT